MAIKNSGILNRYLYSLQTTRARHFLRAARRPISKYLVASHTTALMHGQVRSTIKGVFAGGLMARMYEVPKRIQKTIDPITKEYAYKIFAKSQELVPIDKKYIGRVNLEDRDSYIVVRGQYKIKGSYKYSVPVYSDKDGYLARYKSMSTASAHAKEFTKVKLPSGIYIGEQKDFIERFYRTTSTERTDLLFVNKRTGRLEEYSIKRGTGKEYPFGPKDLKPVTSTTTAQRTGGNQELKKSGRVDETYIGGQYSISYDPRRLGTRFNYANLQHNKLNYKHQVGESLFLYNAFEWYKQKYFNAVKEATGYVIKEFNRT